MHPRLIVRNEIFSTFSISHSQFIYIGVRMLFIFFKTIAYTMASIE